MGFVKFILYAIIFYYCFLFITRFLVKFFLTRWINKVNKNIHKKQKKPTYKEHESGDTVVQYKKDKNVDPGGDYVEFEDVNNE